MPPSSARLNNLPPYVFSVISDRLRSMQAEGIDVLRLDIGNPDMPPPDNVIEALNESSTHPGKHGYSGYRGIPAFRKAIAAHYKSRFDVDLNPDTQVLPLLGSKEGIINLCLAYLSQPSDVSLIPSIGYPSYQMGAILSGGTYYSYKTNEDTGFLPDFDGIPADTLRDAKLLWVNYPNNPTGMSVDLTFYKKALDYCRQHDIILVSDNPYVDVVFNGVPSPSALQASPSDLTNVVEFYSFSKSYNMAGWRLGALVGDENVIRNVLSIKTNIDSGHFHPIYDAGIVALQTPQSWIDERNAVYQHRRDKIMAALPKIGLSADTPTGSMYIWAKINNTNVGEAYVEHALNEAHVSLAPGAAYGPDGTGYVRISLGVPDERLERALQQLEQWYGSIPS